MCFLLNIFALVKTGMYPLTCLNREWLMLERVWYGYDHSRHARSYTLSLQHQLFPTVSNRILGMNGLLVWASMVLLMLLAWPRCSSIVSTLGNRVLRVVGCAAGHAKIAFKTRPTTAIFPFWRLIGRRGEREAVGCILFRFWMLRLLAVLRLL